MQQMIGETVSVLIEKKSEDIYEGYTTNYIRTVVESSTDIDNKIVQVKVIKANNDYITGSLLKEDR